ncbi:MAG: hypothetical protein HY726_22105 [Candidatus Rokubacteria bacterium]|nr:hypothetical protein [Candidatus Rokubacteria bacterium]
MTTRLFEKRRAVELAWTPSPERHRESGPAVAAILSAALGLMTLALVNLFTQASKGFDAWVHGIGKLWMPGAEGIGPYSGKETLSLAVWVGGWIVLHLLLRRRELSLGYWLVVFLVGIGIATTLLWPPVFEYLAGH